jgi:hypothetical protein
MISAIKLVLKFKCEQSYYLELLKKRFKHGL